MGRTLKEHLLLAGLTAFFISLFLPDMPVVGNILVALLFIHCFFYDSIAHRLQYLRSRPMLLLLLLFYAMQLISAALSANHHEAIKLIVRRCPLAVFPLSIGSIFIPARLYRRCLLSYAAATSLAALVFFLLSVIRVWRTADTQWLYDDSLTRWMNRPSTYMAWMVTIALVSYFTILTKTTLARKHKLLIYTAIAFLLIFHYLLASRSSIIFLYGTMLILAVRYAWRIRKPAILLPIPILAIGLILIFPKTVNRFRELQYTGYDLHSQAIESHYNMPVTDTQWNGANLRLAIWNCGLDLARRHWFTGVPLGDKENALQHEYQTRGFAFAYARKRNLHSTYLDVLVNTGVPGLVLFLLAAVIMPLIRAIKEGCLFAALVNVAIAMALVTENWLDQSQGCILLGFWLSFLPAAYSPLSRIYNRTASSVSPKKTRLPWAI